MGQQNQLSGAAASSAQSHFMATFVPHPLLTRTDADSSRVFLPLYEQYKREILSRVQQLTAGWITTESVKPINVKFCVDPEILVFVVALGFIEGIEDYDQLTIEALQSYLEDMAEESKAAFHPDTLDTLVRTDLRVYLNEKNARSSIEELFISYHNVLRLNGLKWLINSNQKVAFYHVLSAIQPRLLHDRLESNF